jgi:energy-coupling factor transporter ATP-binding protein EcfA2
MIRTLKVERFKSLVKLELELGRINVFIGANGSGKSNLLEAVGVLGSAAFGRVDDETLLRRGVRPGVPSLYKTAFPSKDKVPRIFFGATSPEGAKYEVSLWNPIENPDPAWRFMTERLERVGGEEVVTRGVKKYGKRNQEQGIAALETVNLGSGDPALTLMDELRAYSIHCPNTPSLRGLVQDLQSREPVGLAGGRLPEAIEELLLAAKKNPALAEVLEQVRDLLDWASDFSAAPSAGVPLSPSAARSRLVIEFVDRFMAKGRNILTGYDASEGALHILYCAVLALHPKAPRCLAVDNLDQALNPRLAQKLMAALCSWNERINGGRQWLITIHNPAILDGIPLTNPEVRLFAVDRNTSGYTVVKRIDLAAALAKRPDEGWTLSRMWMTGLLGGVPNV